MRKFGLIGESLAHSFSKEYFTKKFQRLNIDASYQLYEMQNISEIRDLCRRENLAGVNITIPFKEKVMDYLDEISQEVKTIGAVNVVKVSGENLKGYNSDYEGFKGSLLRFIGDNRPQALVLGSGGASKAVIKVLDDLSIDWITVSRRQNKGITYDQLNSDLISENKLIINCTPLGMGIHMDESPQIPYHALSSGHFCFDLIYNPERTLFLTKSESYGAKIQNGLEMLHIQAEKSWEIWNT